MYDAMCLLSTCDAVSGGGTQTADVSDGPAGSGWWQASDGRWYPPEQHPAYTPPASYPPPGAYPPGGYAPYGYAPYGYAPVPQTSGKATAALITSIASFVICPVVPAIVALVLAAQAKTEIEESEGQQTGAGLVTASRIVSIANLALSALVTVFVVLILIAAASDTTDQFSGGLDESPGNVTAQRNLEQVLFTERLVRVETERYTADPAVLATYEPTLTYRASTFPDGVSVVVVDLADDAVVLATESSTGECFYVRERAGETAYARDDACGSSEDQSYSDSW